MENDSTLTRRQKEVLSYIKEYIQEHQFPPSVRDIAQHFQLSSAGGVHKHLKMLEKKGVISLNKNTSRSIRILSEPVETPSTPFELPLKGDVAAGAPIEYHIDNEFMSIPVEMVRYPEKSYVLRVRGNSMIEDCIQDGDFIVVEDRNTAANGETVIAMINHEEATLKKFYHEGHQIRLQPANFQMEPIIVKPENLTIQGVLVAVLRRYH